MSRFFRYYITESDLAVILTSVGFPLLLLFLSVQHGFTQSGDESQAVETRSASETYAVKVGQYTISRDRFRRSLKNSLDKMRRQYEQNDKADSFNEQKLRKQAKERIKLRFVNRLVVKHHAKKEGIDIDESRVHKAIKSLNEKAGSSEELKKILKKRGTTLEEYRTKIKDKLRMRRYLRIKVDPPTVSDTEIRTVYEENDVESSLDEVRSQIEQRIYRKKYERATSDFVTDLKEKTEIKLNIDDL